MSAPRFQIVGLCLGALLLACGSDSDGPVLDATSSADVAHRTDAGGVKPDRGAESDGPFEPDVGTGGDGSVGHDGTTSDVNCQDACTTGEVVCEGNGIKECQLLGACAGWSTVVPCQSGQKCTGGKCVTFTITGVSFDWSTHLQLAVESDNFPMTWHPNGHQYTSWGDGWGFQNIKVGVKHGLGFSRVEGNPPAITGIDLYEGDAQGPPTGTWDGKSYGIVAIGTTLYAWISPGSINTSPGNFDEARLVTSIDDGKTWKAASWAFTKAEKVIMPSILQFGIGYTGAKDNYVYMYNTRLAQAAFSLQTPGNADLMRAPKGKLLNKAAYEYFGGLDAAGKPIWTKVISQRKPVLTQTFLGWAPPSVSFVPGINRYLLVTDYDTQQGQVGKGLALYSAPEPWGPWSKVIKIPVFAEGSTFFYNFPSKWINPNGKEAWMVFTGINKTKKWDSFNLIRVTLSVS